MEVSFEPGSRPGGVLATVVGDLDLYASVEFCNLIIGKMREGFPRVALDVHGVSYLDSSGVGAIIRLVQLSRALGGGIALIGLNGTPRKVLEMSNIVSLVKLFADKPLALAEWC